MLFVQIKLILYSSSNFNTTSICRSTYNHFTSCNCTQLARPPIGLQSLASFSCYAWYGL